MRAHIPLGIMNQAVKSAKEDSQNEVIGFFVAEPVPHRQGEGGVWEYRIAWRKFENVHPSPKTHAEMDARAIADMIIDDKCQPLAMFHSHPSGSVVPSSWDLVGFPHAYVEQCFIWANTAPQLVTLYTDGGFYSQVPINEVFIQVEA